MVNVSETDNKRPRRKVPCPTCKSVGFPRSVLSDDRCTFCDGTEGGHEPNVTTAREDALVGINKEKDLIEVKHTDLERISDNCPCFRKNANMYPVDKKRRPWAVHTEEAFSSLQNLAQKWLKERGGIIVYENHMMDSSHLGETSFMPARFIAEEDDAMHDAPMQRRPHGGLPSLRQEAVDHITAEQYDGDPVNAFNEAFVKEVPCPG